MIPPGQPQGFWKGSEEGIMGMDEDAPVKGRGSSPCPSAPWAHGPHAGIRQCPSNKYPWLHQMKMCVLPSRAGNVTSAPRDSSVLGRGTPLVPELRKEHLYLSALFKGQGTAERQAGTVHATDQRAVLGHGSHSCISLFLPNTCFL